MHTGSMLHASEKQAFVDDTHDQRTRCVFAHVAYILYTALVHQAHSEELGSFAAHRLQG